MNDHDVTERLKALQAKIDKLTVELKTMTEEQEFVERIARLLFLEARRTDGVDKLHERIVARYCRLIKQASSQNEAKARALEALSALQQLNSKASHE